MTINIYMKSRFLITKEVNDDQLDEICEALRIEDHQRFINIDDELNSIYINVSEIEFVEVVYVKGLS